MSAAHTKIVPPSPPAITHLCATPLRIWTSCTHMIGSEHWIVPGAAPSWCDACVKLEPAAAVAEDEDEEDEDEEDEEEEEEEEDEPLLRY